MSFVAARADKIHTEIPTIIDPSATIDYPSATKSKIVGISVRDDACWWHVMIKINQHVWIKTCESKRVNQNVWINTCADTY